MWNDLPEKTKQAASLYCFKKVISLFSLFLLIVINFSNCFKHLYFVLCFGVFKWMAHCKSASAEGPSPLIEMK